MILSTVPAPVAAAAAYPIRKWATAGLPVSVTTGVRLIRANVQALMPIRHDREITRPVVKVRKQPVGPVAEFVSVGQTEPVVAKEAHNNGQATPIIPAVDRPIEAAKRENGGIKDLAPVEIIILIHRPVLLRPAAVKRGILGIREPVPVDHLVVPAPLGMVVTVSIVTLLRPAALLRRLQVMDLVRPGSIGTGPVVLIIKLLPEKIPAQVMTVRKRPARQAVAPVSVG